MNYNAAVIYRGPSMLTGDPLVVILTSLKRKSRNEKVGPNVVGSLILRTDMDPITATKKGKDDAICGNCKHRPFLGGGCYVRVGEMPLSVWTSWASGNIVEWPLNEVADKLAGRVLRMGSYGDPAAVPIDVWHKTTRSVRRRMGYTHLWRRRPAFRRYCMASVDSPEERDEAKAKGWRTFRVRDEGDPLLPGEIQCPAAIESEYRRNCETCGACSGGMFSGKYDVSIVRHGGKTGRRRRSVISLV